MIKLNGISKSFKTKLAVDNVSLHVDSGEIVGFIGPNGAGKSTTIKVLLNYIVPDKGSGTILDLDVTTQSHLIKKDVGYVSSEVNFYSEFSASKIIKLAMKFHNSSDEDYYDYLINQFQVEEHKKMKDLSLGNKKKVALVCALVIKPKVLIMDEPTNGLDPLVQKTLFKIVKEQVENGCAVLISSHNMQEIQEHCDRVLFIKNGSIIKEIKLDDYKLYGKYVKAKGDVSKLQTIATEILKHEKDNISIIYEGDLKTLLQVLSDCKLEDVIIEDLSMEHQFLKYYVDEVSV